MYVVLMNQIPWGTKCLCGELYGVEGDWGPIAGHVQWLEHESGHSSKWADVVPQDIDG